MSDSLVRGYLQPPCGNLWSWQDHGECVVWNDTYVVDHLTDQVIEIPSTTIVFNTHLWETLCQMHGVFAGLPSLSAYLLIANACQVGWTANADRARLRELLLSTSTIGKSENPNRAPLKNILLWLEQVAVVRADLERRLPKNTDTAAAIMQYGFRCGCEMPVLKADDLLTPLRSRLLDGAGELAYEARPPLTGAASAQVCLETIQTLLQLSHLPIEADHLEAFIRSGVVATFNELGRHNELDSDDLDGPVEALEDSLVSPTTWRELIDELGQDANHRPIAAAAIQFASFLSLPAKLSSTSVLPDGGFTDISNRGALENLLISELAAPKHLFAARIANGQALYRRREEPPAERPSLRQVLVENGIRMWGRQRLFALSAALGIAGADQRRNQTQCQFITIDGQHAESVQLDSRGSIIAYLEKLSASLCPGDAVLEWHRGLIDGNLAASMAQPVIVVSDATERDLVFRQALGKLSIPCWVLAIDETGEASLSVWQKGQREPKRRLRVQWNETDAEDSLPRWVTEQENLPQFMLQRLCPLFFPPHVDRPPVMPFAFGGYIVDQDHQLLYLHSHKRGAVLVASHFPNLVLNSSLHQERFIAVVATEDGRHVLVVDQGQSLEPTYMPLSNSAATDRYEFDGDTLFRLGQGYGDRVEKICTRTGEIKASGKLMGTPIGGPVVHAGNVAIVLRPRSGTIVNESFKLPDSMRHAANRHQQIACRFLARRNTQGEIQIADLQSGRFAKTLAKPHSSHWSMSPPNQSSGIPIVVPSWKVGLRTGDSSRLVLIPRSGNQRPFRNPQAAKLRPHRNLTVRFDDEKLVADDFESPLMWMPSCAPGVHRLLRRFSVFKKFAGISFRPDGFELHFRGHRCYRLEVNAQQVSLRQMSRARPRFAFPRSSRVSTTLGPSHWKIAHLVHGQFRFTSDSRGLLHIRDQVENFEVSLLLCVDQIAGWTTDGECFGCRYFLSAKSDRQETGENETHDLPDRSLEQIRPSEGLQAWFRQAAAACSTIKEGGS